MQLIHNIVPGVLKIIPNKIMGIVFGITGSKEPTFQLLKSGKYEIRKYNPYFIAEVSCDNSNEEFQILAKYIGVWGNPENMLSKYILFSNCLTCLLYIFFFTLS